MTKLLDDWEPPPCNVTKGRGLGRTTQMLSCAITLAVQPQVIVTLWPNHEIAKWGFHYCLDLLDANVGAGFRILRKNGPPIIGFAFSEIHFVEARAVPGQYLARGIHSLSIIEDHTFHEYAHRGGDNYRHHYEQWQRAINHVQHLSESRQTKDSLWLALTTS